MNKVRSVLIAILLLVILIAILWKMGLFDDIYLTEIKAIDIKENAEILQKPEVVAETEEDFDLNLIPLVPIIDNNKLEQVVKKTLNSQIVENDFVDRIAKRLLEVCCVEICPNPITVESAQVSETGIMSLTLSNGKIVVVEGLVKGTKGDPGECKLAEVVADGDKDQEIESYARLIVHEPVVRKTVKPKRKYQKSVVRLKSGKARKVVLPVAESSDLILACSDCEIDGKGVVIEPIDHQKTIELNGTTFTIDSFEEYQYEFTVK